MKHILIIFVFLVFTTKLQCQTLPFGLEWQMKREQVYQKVNYSGSDRSAMVSMLKVLEDGIYDALFGFDDNKLSSIHLVIARGPDSIDNPFDIYIDKESRFYEMYGKPFKDTIMILNDAQPTTNENDLSLLLRKGDVRFETMWSTKCDFVGISMEDYTGPYSNNKPGWRISITYAENTTGIKVD